MSDLKARLSETAGAVEAELEMALSEGAPTRLLAAMRYAVLGGGKRLRPFLLAEAGRLCGAAPANALRAGAALELVHAYSLVHDDLPSMDDDDLRRGKPTLHIAFDEATAVLAGDALLTLAFEMTADPRTHDDAIVRAALITKLARAAGGAGMVGGQMMDLEAEGRFGAVTGARDESHVRLVQAGKTGALFAYACEAGALLGGADDAQQAALRDYADAFGYAFQIADDVLDVTATPDEMGKATAKDAKAGKATLVDLLGLDGARKRLDEEVDRAQAALVPFGDEAGPLRDLAAHARDRRN